MQTLRMDLNESVYQSLLFIVDPLIFIKYET